MILSHRHRFIFLKTRKTAGTSIELALSPLCGPEDVLAPLGRVDEAKRAGCGARNFVVPPRQRPLLAPLRRLVQGPENAGYLFFNHMTAAQLKRVVPAEVFGGYLKVTIERNPWDREVSRYYFAHRKAAGRPSFDAFVRDQTRRKPLNNYAIYSLDGTIVADVVMRFERLEEDFAALLARLGIAERPAIGNAKGARRPEDTRDYRALYSAESREIVGRIYAREIAAFGYEF